MRIRPRGDAALATGPLLHSITPGPVLPDRYARFDLIRWFSREAIRDVRLLLVGAGALGNEVLKNLALFGVGHVAVCDFDSVELSNLSRALLFVESDIGENKAVAAARAANRINPHVRVTPLTLNILGEVGTAFFGAFDVVIGAVDTREGRLAINRACWKMSKPFIDGALDVLSGVVKVFVPPASACYECTMSPEDFTRLPGRTSCGLLAREAEGAGAVPTTPISAAIVGALQTQEVLKLLHPTMAAKRLSGEGYVFDGVFFDPMTVRFQRKSNDVCHSHVAYECVHEVPGSRRTVAIGDLCAWARSEHNLECTYVGFERDIITHFQCQACNHVEAINRPYALFRSDPGACPACGSHVRRASWCPGRSVADLPPSITPFALGVPPMDILTLQSTEAELRVTLVGDRAELLPDDFFGSALIPRRTQ